MRIGVTEGHLTLRAIDLDGMLGLEELRLDATEVELGSAPDTYARGEFRATLSVAESQVNRFLSGHTLNGARDVQIAMLSGRVRISGKKMLGPIGVPFALNAVPEVVSGTTIRLDPTRITLVGAHLPDLSLGYLGDWLNQHIAGIFDASKLPIPVRLTSIAIEPGLATLSGIARLDLRPGQLALLRSDPA